MSPDREILTALLCEVSRQSAPFQSLIHDYSADVMNDPEVRGLFAARLDADLPMRREIEILKASLSASAAGPLSQAMNVLCWQRTRCPSVAIRTRARLPTSRPSSWSTSGAIRLPNEAPIKSAIAGSCRSGS